MELREFKKAVTYYTKAIELDSEWADYYKKRGVAYEKLDKPQQALKDYNKKLGI